MRVLEYYIGRYNIMLDNNIAYRKEWKSDEVKFEFKDYKLAKAYLRSRGYVLYRIVLEEKR